MPVSVSCTNCRAPYNLADVLRGKSVRCKWCAHVFAVPLGELVELEIVDDDRQLDSSASPLVRASSNLAQLATAEEEPRIKYRRRIPRDPRALHKPAKVPLSLIVGSLAALIVVMGFLILVVLLVTSTGRSWSGQPAVPQRRVVVAGVGTPTPVLWSRLGQNGVGLPTPATAFK